jgi:HD-like signal output (HDOD) protein
MNEAEVKQYIKGLNDLPTIPALLGKILSVLRDADSSPDDLFRLISHDQALAERVVKTANSVFFGHPGQILDIEQAIMFLGFNKIKSIVAGAAVMDVFPSKTSFSIRNLWIHSYETAFIASVISNIVEMTRPAECFLSGLLHDVGRIIFYKIDHKKFYSIQTNDDMLEKEIEVFGCTHAEAGAWFAEENGMPEEIIYTTRFHHSPSKTGDYKEAVAIISLAEGLSRKLSPKIEDDGLWTAEHSALLLECSLKDEHMMHIAEKFAGAKFEIENFF